MGYAFHQKEVLTQLRDVLVLEHDSFSCIELFCLFFYAFMDHPIGALPEFSDCLVLLCEELSVLEVRFEDTFFTLDAESLGRL